MLSFKKISFFLLLLISATNLWAQQTAADTTTPRRKKAPQFDLPHQLRFGVDIARPIQNLIYDNRTSYEFQADYYIGREVYAAAEGGWGNAQVPYSDLNYSSTNSFFRVGVDKSMLQRLTGKDWDMAFIGARYGIAFIQRSNATYTTEDPMWGVTSGTVPGKSLMAHWMEITGGVRVELLKDWFLGWNVRGKFLLNQGALKELPPAYIAGYGKGDKNTTFDFNFYVSYAIRWSKKKPKA